MKKYLCVAFMSSLSLFADSSEDYQEQRDNPSDYNDEKWEPYANMYRELRDFSTEYFTHQ